MATTLYSDQITNLRATPPVLNSGIYEGRVVRRGFTYTVPAATIAAGDTLMCTFIRAGEIMYGGVWKNTAGGAAATGKIQNYTSLAVADLVDDSKWGTLTDMTNATSQTFGDTNAKDFMEQATAFWYVGVLTAAQAIQAAAVIQGYIDVLVP